ncbi:MAG TPA: hypothetical protein VFR66_02100 [Burkholderiales bacterium]|nr:hypothetical protein [Burkholderiales bacterium]
MKATTVLALAAAIALGSAGCDRNAAQSKSDASSAEAGAGASAPRKSSTPTTPANVGQPSQAEKHEGANPVQQQVDPKQREQERDFRTRGEGAGWRGGG